MARQARRALVCGAGGFIGGRLVKRLKAEGFWVPGVDLKRPEFCASAADEFVQGDLRDPRLCEEVVQGTEDVYQLAADMGVRGSSSRATTTRTSCTTPRRSI
jgi:nucleoside-diphosphate-sugar epimerase